MGASPPSGCLYAFPLRVSGEGLDRKKYFLSGDTDLSDLTNEVLSRPMAFYYDKSKAHDRKDLWEFLNLSLSRWKARHRKRLELIVATGLTPGEYSRYVKICQKTHCAQKYPRF